MRNGVQVSHPATTVTKIRETTVEAEAWDVLAELKMHWYRRFFSPSMHK